MKKEIEAFVEDFLKEIRADNAAIFAGAGLSVPAGFVDWKGLLKPLAAELNLDIDREADLIALAQFHVNSNGMNRHQLSQAVMDALGVPGVPTRNHKLLASLPISTYWTTNYDRLIELALTDAGKLPDVKHSVKQLANTRSRRDAVVYKMHGDVDHAQDAVMTKDDYEKYHRTHGAFVNALSGDLVSKTFLFVGFSFTDPNLDYVLSRIRVTFEQHQRRHYAFFKRREKSVGETDEVFEFARVRQLLMIDDLKRFNVKVLLVDSYGEITEAFEEIARRYRKQTIFVSSSASQFSPWGEDAVTQFMRALGVVLIDNSFKVATGLGLGVGNALFSGALEQVFRSRSGRVDDRFLIRPFPQYVSESSEREKLWENYRRDFIPEAGIALFLFGNKMSGADVVDAIGMVREFEIACEAGLTLLPIGGTGSVAAKIADRALGEPSSYLQGMTPEALELLTQLSKPADDLMTLLDPITKLLRLVK